jgi:hypothetical protein
MGSAFENLTNALHNLVKPKSTEHQAKEEYQVPALQPPKDLAKEIDKIEKDLQTAVKNLKPGYAKFSRKLDVAIEELYHLAVFIGGDARDLELGLNQNQFKALQVSVMAKFVEVEEENDRAWKALCATHDRVGFAHTTDQFARMLLTLTISPQSTELREHSLQRVDDMGSLRIEHVSVESSIIIANERMVALQCARDDIGAAREALEDSRWYNDASKIASNVGVSQSPARLIQDHMLTGVSSSAFSPWEYGTSSVS